MSNHRPRPSPRRAFLTQLGLATGALAGSAPLFPVVAESSYGIEPSAPWDLSWVEKVEKAKYRIVIDANVIEDGIAIDHAATMLDQFHEVYNTPDDQTRVLLVMRQLGTPMAFNDSIWQRYPVGEDTKITDPATKAPIRRNPFLHAAPGASPESAATKLERLAERGVIVLLCNIAMTNWSRRMASATQRPVEDVKAEAARNLVPGGTLVPSGIFALARAQNAGCAFLRAS
jgi:intracellular sulfur oxidation DsrE/DsrF family protein